MVEDTHNRCGELRVGTAGLLTPEHLAQLQFEQAADTRLRIAHFDGAAESMTQFLGGRTDIAFTTSPFIAALKPLAILSPVPSEAPPDLPTAVAPGSPTLAQLGRAAGRDRVGPYVYILGAAVHFKQQHNNTITDTYITQ